jgi:hypothetical protein
MLHATVSWFILKPNNFGVLRLHNFNFRNLIIYLLFIFIQNLSLPHGIEGQFERSDRPYSEPLNRVFRKFVIRSNIL